jgi:hypothetical protein
VTHPMVDEPDTYDVLEAVLNEGPSDHAEDETEQPSMALFEGDIGTLFQEQRDCLHALLRHRFISADQHPGQWEVLLANQDVMKSRLNDLFLDLHVDRDLRVAFKRAATPEGGDQLPSLLRNVSHTKEETIVMISLRRRFFTQRQEGDFAVFVERATLLEEVADHRPETATHRAMDHKRANNAIDGLATAAVLLRTDDPDRFQISPIIEVLLPIEKLRSLWAWLITSNGADDTPLQDVGDMDDELDTLFDTDGVQE